MQGASGASIIQAQLDESSQVLGGIHAMDIDISRCLEMSMSMAWIPPSTTTTMDTSKLEKG
jgi:hypothetical protein